MCKRLWLPVLAKALLFFLLSLLAGFLPVYLNLKGDCRTVFVQQPPFWLG